jgi:hypothetical protein
VPGTRHIHLTEVASRGIGKIQLPRLGGLGSLDGCPAFFSGDYEA